MQVAYYATTISRHVKFIILNIFAHEILPVERCLKLVDRAFFYEELKDIFKENKNGFDGKSRTLTHLVAFGEHHGRH